MCRNWDIQGAGLNTKYKDGHYSNQQSSQDVEHMAEWIKELHLNRVKELQKRILERKLRQSRLINQKEISKE